MAPILLLAVIFCTLLLTPAKAQGCPPGYFCPQSMNPQSRVPAPGPMGAGPQVIPQYAPRPSIPYNPYISQPPQYNSPPNNYSYISPPPPPRYLDPLGALQYPNNGVYQPAIRVYRCETDYGTCRFRSSRTIYTGENCRCLLDSGLYVSGEVP